MSVEQIEVNTNNDLSYNISHGSNHQHFESHSENLSVQQTPPFPLYDPESVLEIPRNIADGFLILLSGGLTSAKVIQDERKKKSRLTSSGEPTAQSPSAPIVDQSAIQLSFAALTQGNVIEATFGVKSNGGLKRSKYTSEIAYNAAKTAKQAILDVSISSEYITQLTVETYVRCFRIVVKYHVHLDSIGFIAWCIKHQKIRETAVRELEQAFEPLSEVIAASI